MELFSVSCCNEDGEEEEGLMESPFLLMLLLQVHTCCPRLWHQLTVFEVAKSHSGYSTSSSSSTTTLVCNKHGQLLCAGV
jgi:hypothetical protein